jgi:hypothetical protein
MQIPYLESSAKFRQNVDQTFHILIRQIRQFRYLERRTNGHLGTLENGTGRDEVDWREKEAEKKKKNKGTKKEKAKTCRIQ